MLHNFFKANDTKISENFDENFKYIFEIYYVLFNPLDIF